MKLRTTTRLLAALAVAGLLAACGSSEPGNGGDSGKQTEPANHDLKGMTVTIAVENAYPPFNYINKDTNKAEGWDYDTWRAICEKLNCKTKFVETGWEGMIQAVSDDQFDTAGDGITITDERAQVVDFSQGYITVEQRLMVNKGEDRFSTLEEFKSGDYEVGTQTGTTNYETAVKEYGESRVRAFETFPFAVQALLNGDVDAVIIDDTAGQGYVGADREQLELLAGSLTSDDLGFIFPLGSDLVADVNWALDELENDGTLKQINGKYFSPDFEAPVAD